jgi:hypothetical protein
MTPDMVGKSAKIMMLERKKNKKGEVRQQLAAVSSTLPIQQVSAFSISCSKADKEIDLLQDGGKKERTSITTV